MAAVTSHRDLIVWQKSMDLVVGVYGLTSRFPRSEQYRLTDQISRAAVSVPANIAEGHARSTSKDFANFLSIAKGSLMEVETYVLLSVRLGYVKGTETAALQASIIEISKMLTALRRRLVPR